MDNTKNTLSLVEKILIYVEYCLPERRYKMSYVDMRDTLRRVDGVEYSPGTLRKQTSILRSKGLIDSKLRYRKPVDTLSVEGKMKIATALAYKSFGDWDKKWRLVVVQTPNKYRQDGLRLKNKLTSLGFKKIQKNTYISPHPLLTSVDRIATFLGIRQYCLMFEAGDIRHEEQVVEKIWNITEINKRYAEFIRAVDNAKQSDDTWVFRAKMYERVFAAIYADDPHLPAEFLPQSWHAHTAYSHFKTLLTSY